MSASSVFEVIREKSTGALDKARLVFNREADSPSSNSEDSDSQASGSDASSRLEELAEYCPKLSFQERLMGFGISFSLGYLIAFFSFRFFIKLVEGNPIPFAVNYTVGHVLQLSASTFLCGPKKQFMNMFDETRRQTSIIYLSCLGSTILIVFLPLPSSLKLFTLLALTLTQFCASVWYSLSYIPYGRRAALRMLKKAVGLDDGSTASYAGVGIQIGGISA